MCDTKRPIDIETQLKQAAYENQEKTSPGNASEAYIRRNDSYLDELNHRRDHMIKELSKISEAIEYIESNPGFRENLRYLQTKMGYLGI